MAASRAAIATGGNNGPSSRAIIAVTPVMKAACHLASLTLINAHMSVTPSPVPSNGHDAVDDRIDLKRHLIVRASTPQPTAALVRRCWVERP
jgi:hypothetical protein